MFYLALTFGLTEDPPGAVARMAGSSNTQDTDTASPTRSSALSTRTPRS